MNVIETATDVIVLIWMMLVTAYTMMLNKKVNEIRDEILKRIEQTEGIASAAKGGVEGLNGRLTRVQDDLDDIAEGRKNLDRRTVDAIKQHKEALQSLYEYAQRACEIRSNMLQKITDLERCAQAHEAWITEQEEKHTETYERRENSD